jgi:hypothetical protein
MSEDEKAATALEVEVKVGFGKADVVDEHDEREGEDGRLGLSEQTKRTQGMSANFRNLLRQKRARREERT